MKISHKNITPVALAVAMSTMPNLSFSQVFHRDAPWYQTTLDGSKFLHLGPTPEKAYFFDMEPEAPLHITDGMEPPVTELSPGDILGYDRRWLNIPEDQFESSNSPLPLSYGPHGRVYPTTPGGLSAWSKDFKPGNIYDQFTRGDIGHKINSVPEFDPIQYDRTSFKNLQTWQYFPKPEHVVEQKGASKNARSAIWSYVNATEYYWDMPTDASQIQKDPVFEGDGRSKGGEDVIYPDGLKDRYDVMDRYRSELGFYKKYYDEGWKHMHQASVDEVLMARLAEKLTPDVSGGAIKAVLDTQTLTNNAIFNRLESTRLNDEDYGTWMSILATKSHRNYNQVKIREDLPPLQGRYFWDPSPVYNPPHDINGFDIKSSGVSIGHDIHYSDNLTLGADYTYLHSNVASGYWDRMVWFIGDYETKRARLSPASSTYGNNSEYVHPYTPTPSYITHIDSHLFSIYGRYVAGNFFVNTALAYGLNTNHREHVIYAIQNQQYVRRDVGGESNSQEVVNWNYKPIDHGSYSHGEAIGCDWKHRKSCKEETKAMKSMDRKYWGNSLVDYTKDIHHKSHYFSNMLGFEILSGYSFELDKITLKPLIGVRLSALDTDGYQEEWDGSTRRHSKESGYDVKDLNHFRSDVIKSTTTAMRTSFDRHIVGEFGYGFSLSGKYNIVGGILKPKVKVMSYYEPFAEATEVKANYFGGNRETQSFTDSSFIAIGNEPKRRTYEAKLVADYKIDHTTFSFNYSLTKKEDFKSNSISAGIHYEF